MKGFGTENDNDLSLTGLTEAIEGSAFFTGVLVLTPERK